MKRLANAFAWILPLLYCLWLYRWGLQAWFQQDDFAWLGLPLHVNQPRDLWNALFSPMAQGTIRPWSERLFFLVFAQVSWMDPRPFHACVFVTAAAVLTLLQWIVRRLSGSVTAGVTAPVIWLSGIGPANPMSWLSSYNQVLESFFLLAGLAALIRAIETGRRSWWVAQWALFLLGFGALETHVVYPFLALLYAALFARTALRRVAWMVPVSILYAGLNFAFAPKPTEGPYARHWDTSMVPTFFQYAGMALTGGQVLPGSRLPAGSWLWAALALGFVLLGFAAWAARRRSYTAAFGIGWFVLTLGPLLPLRDHVMDYYLTTAGLGVAVAFAALAAEAAQRPWPWRAAAAALLAVHLVYVLPINRTITRWRYERGERIRVLVQGLERAAELHPGKVILLTGIDSELFWSCLLDSPGRLFGAQEVYLAPGEEKNLDRHEDLGNIRAYVADPSLTGRTLFQRSAVIYRYEGTVLRNITNQYRREIPSEWLYEKPRLVDAAHPAFATDLGEGWYPSDGSFRWMAREAVVRLAPPREGDHLFVSAYLPLNLQGRARQLHISLNGVALPTVQVPPDSEWIEANLLISKDLVGKPAEIRLRVDRTVRLPGDETEYGLAFGKLGFR